MDPLLRRQVGADGLWWNWELLGPERARESDGQLPLLKSRLEQSSMAHRLPQDVLGALLAAW